MFDLFRHFYPISAAVAFFLFFLGRDFLLMSTFMHTHIARPCVTRHTQKLSFLTHQFSKEKCSGNKSRNIFRLQKMCLDFKGKKGKTYKQIFLICDSLRYSFSPDILLPLLANNLLSSFPLKSSHTLVSSKVRPFGPHDSFIALLCCYI